MTPEQEILQGLSNLQEKALAWKDTQSVAIDALMAIVERHPDEADFVLQILRRINAMFEEAGMC